MTVSPTPISYRHHRHLPHVQWAVVWRLVTAVLLGLAILLLLAGDAGGSAVAAVVAAVGVAGLGRSR